jgi:hypothetical protein
VDEHGGFRLGESNVIWENPFRSQPEFPERPQSPESLVMQLRSSEEHSLLSFPSRRSGSPGPILTAIGFWTDSHVFNPLSLAPQHLFPRDAHLASIGDDDGSRSMCAAASHAASSYVYPGSIDADDLRNEN